MKKKIYNLKYYCDNAGTYYNEEEIPHDKIQPKVKELVDRQIKLEDIKVWEVTPIDLSIEVNFKTPKVMR